MTFNQLFNLINTRKLPFLVVFFVTALVSYGFLYAIDFYPEPVTESAVENSEETDDSQARTSAGGSDENSATVETSRINNQAEIDSATAIFRGAALPTMIYFETLDKEVAVLNPVSSDITDLDEALLDGAVRHPESADFSAEGNMFILAHSSYLPNVLNRNFQAFNGIQNLSWGDKIRVRSADTEYVYRVEKVYEAKASEVIVPHTPGESRLTLATCDSFGSTDDRFMVEATLIGSYQLDGESV